MYFPYFRLKQEEAIAIRSVADLIAPASQTPIIEPVKRSQTAMRRMIEIAQNISNLGGDLIIIINPSEGDFSRDNTALITAINQIIPSTPNLIVGILIDNNTSITFLQGLLSNYNTSRIAIIHKTMSAIPNISTLCGGVTYNIFIEGQVSSAYPNAFGGQKVLLNDGFNRQNNADYVPDEYFSSLHLTYGQQGYNGFGDFLTVGDFYRGGGGPAYAVALHLTYFRLPPNDPDLYIKHFISVTNDSVQNPAGKFAEAIASFESHMISPNCVIENTRGVRELRAYHASRHYPGLGMPKRLSMMHHMEIMANRFP